MPIQMIKLEEVMMFEVSDETLEAAVEVGGVSISHACALNVFWC